MDASERDKIGEMLSAYLDGELSGDQTGAVERLIADEAEARALLVELREAADGVRQLPRAVAPSGILTEIQERVERRELLGPPDQPVTLSRHQRRPLRSILATAAALVITVGGGLWAIGKLGGRPQQRHAGLSVSDDSSRIQGQLDDSRRFTRDQKPAAVESSSELKEAPETFFEKRSDAEKRRSASEPQSAVRSMPAPAPTTAPRADKDRPVRPADGDEYELGLKQSRDLEAVDAVAGGRSTVADQPKAGVDVRDRLTDSFEMRSATLEQKLSRDVTVGALLDHPFANEPLHLEIQVAGAEQVPAVAQRVRALIRSGGDRPLGYSARSKMREAPLELEPGLIDDKTSTLGADRWLVMEGEPLHNFRPADQGEKQYLARVDTDTLVRILDATRDGGGAIVGRRFAVGRMQAETDQDVERLAAMTLGEPYTHRAEGAAGAVESDAIKQSDGDRETTIDLAELLRGIGVGPPDVSEFGVGSDESRDSTKPSPADAEKRFADAGDVSDDEAMVPPGKGQPVAPSQEGLSPALRERRAGRGGSRETGKTDESEAPRTDEDVALSAKESAGQLTPDGQPANESGIGESEFEKSQERESKSKKSESKVKPVGAMDSKTEQLAKRKNLTPQSPPPPPPPLYTIVIRLVPVQSQGAQGSDAAGTIETGQSQNVQPPRESASPTPAASPSPANTNSVAPQPAKPE